MQLHAATVKDGNDDAVTDCLVAVTGNATADCAKPHVAGTDDNETLVSLLNDDKVEPLMYA